MKKILLILFIFVITVLSATYYYSMQINKSVIYQVKSGASIISIAHDLQKRGIVNSSDLLIYIARLKNIKPKAGYYEISAMRQFLDDLHHGNTLTDTITLLPGKTTKDYYEQLRNTRSVKVSRTLNEIITEIGLHTKDTHYEGQFLAESFNIKYGDSALSIFKRSHELYANTLDNMWQQREKSNYVRTPYTLTILASMVEKESGNEEEKSTIAGVFINRLQKNMRLQSDPTTIYALKKLGIYDGDLTKKNLKTKSPYNTYTIKGLPVGAISNVSKGTLLAASKPEKHGYYYFVAKHTTAHAFARTYEEHKQNIKKYLTQK